MQVIYVVSRRLAGHDRNAQANATGNPQAQREILLHRKIDSCTDRHPEVLEAKRHFPNGVNPSYRASQ